jgi:UDP-N-acetylmuramoylalanine--D-glutamate ligase
MEKKHLSAIFFGKKITQMGLGLLGRGVGDADFLARHGADLTITDVKSKEILASSHQTLAHHANISWRLGEHVQDDFRERDLVLKSAGVPLDSPFIQEARNARVPVDMSASLFARIAQIPLVGVTGTRGKSTVTSLIHALLVADGRETLLGGNIKGVANLPLLEKVTSKSIGVFELDSWQCQGFEEETSLENPLVKQGAHSPSIAVFTTFLPDHLNYYKGNMDAYLADKAHIFLHQHESDVCVLGQGTLDALSRYKKNMRAHVVVPDTKLPKGWRIKLLGAHNAYNAMLALAVARALGVSDEIVREVFETFDPLDGRLSFVREVRGVSFYNDTNGTTPDALSASLSALDPEGKKRIVLIAGGADKNLPLELFIKSVWEHAKACIFFEGTGTARLPEDMLHAKENCVVSSMQDAVQEANARAEEGDVVLLSPGFASFGVFKDEYDRGEQFLACVRELH